MRARVYQAIGKQIADNCQNKPYWIKQKENFYQNRISTFHSFCGDILRQYPLEAGIDPEFNILDQYAADDLLYETVSEQIDRLAKTDKPKELNILNKLWSRNQIIGYIIKLIKARSQVTAWLDRFSQLDFADYMTQINLYRDNFLGELLAEIKEKGIFQQELADIYKFINSNDKKTPTEIKKSKQILILYPKLINIWQKPVQAQIELLTEFKGQLGLRGLKNPQFKESLKIIRDIIDGAKLADYEIDEALEQEVYNYLKALAHLTQTCLIDYQVQKKEDNSLDFEDLQLFCLQLLKSTDYLYIKHELQHHFRYIMVDEFQDTNNLQWQIIRLLASDDKDRLTKDKLFIVGDEKQSIYAFRGADVSIFADAKTQLHKINQAYKTDKLPFELPAEYKEEYRRLSADEKMSLQTGEVILEHNFRSSAGVMRFINAFFEKLFYRRKYRPYDAEPQAQTCNSGLNGTGVELMLVEKHNNNQRQENEDNEKIDGYLKEAHLIAKKIKYVLGEKPAEYSHVVEKFAAGEPAVAILLSRRNNIKIYEDALRRENIDFIVSRGRGFYQRQEIIDIINVLEFINQPYNSDIALAGALRSPIIGLSDDALLTICSQSGNSLWDKFCSLFDGLIFCHSEQSEESAPHMRVAPSYDLRMTNSLLPGFLPADIKLLPEAYKSLSGWIKLKDCLTISEMIIKILDDSQLYTSLASGGRGAQNIANMDKLIELARGFDNDLWGWLAFLKSRFKNADEGEAELQPESTGVVQLMTIHQAKGLEFPLVFLPDLSASCQFSSKDSLVMDNIDSFFEVGIKAPHPNLEAGILKKIIGWQQNQKTLAEYRRLLYVAATRAENHLILVGQTSSKPVGKSLSFMDWIKEILDIDSLADLKMLYLADRQESRIGIPVTLFDANEEITPHMPTPVIDTILIDKQVDNAAENQELSDIINNLKPPVIIQYPVFSPSALLEYRVCPLRYYYKHIMGIAEAELDTACSFNDTPQDIGHNLAAIRGSIVHSIIQDGIFSADYINTRINNLLPYKLSAEEYNLFKDEVNLHIRHITEHPKYRAWHKSENKNYREINFKLKIGDFYLQGAIDLLFFDNKTNNWLIVDYKSNKVDKTEDIDNIIRHSGYDFQLKCYALAASRILLPASVYNACLFFSYLPEIVYFNFSIDELKQFEMELNILADKIKSEKFDEAAQDKKQCQYCGYYQLNRC